MSIKSIFKNNKENESDEKSGPVTAQKLRNIFTDCYDFEERRVFPGGREELEATLFFIDGLVSGKDIGEQVLRPLTDEERFRNAQNAEAVVSLMMTGQVYAYTAKTRTETDDVVKDMLNGYCAIVLEKINTAVTFEVKSGEKRSVSEPKEEKVVKGPKDAFVELLKINTALVRRKLRNPNLKIKEHSIGDKTHTTVAIVYLDGFTNRNIVAEAERRLKNIDSEDALSAAVIAENIVDNPRSPFPQILSSERPDKFCINILEGRVGILVDGLPVGFMAPGTFSQYFKVPEDHSSHFLVASVLTIIRYFSLVLTLLLPAFYVAVSMYHQEMIPSKLLQSIIDAKQSVPFPTAFEVLALLASFELLQEAGLRLPNPIGETISIIGALIVGQSAVEAKVVSPAVVVVIALAGIAGYTMPNQDMSAALRICRFLLVIMAIVLGMFGLVAGFALLLNHLGSLESLGVPYMSPFCGAEGKHKDRALLRRSMRVKRNAEPELKPEGKQ